MKKINNLKAIKIILIVLITIISGSDNIYAQKPIFDSLWNAFKQAKRDTTRILFFLNIGDIYEYNMPDSAIFFYQKAFNLSEENISASLNEYPTNLSGINNMTNLERKFLSLKATSISYIGIIHKEQGNYAQAIEYYQKALKIGEGFNGSSDIATVTIGKKLMSKCYSYIGIVHFLQGSYDNAIEYFIKSLKIEEELNNKSGMTYCYNFIGQVYYKIGSYYKAIEYYQISLKISEELNDKIGMIYCYNNIAGVHFEKGNYEESIEYIQNALKIVEEINDKKEMSNCYSNLGSNYKKQGNFDKATEYYLKALKIKQELNDINGLAIIYLNIADLNISLADSSILNENQRFSFLNKAIEYGIRAYDLAVEIDALPTKNNAAESLKNAYIKIGRFKEAIKFAEIFIATKDSMFSEEKTKSLAEMGAKYESEKRELTIQKLEKEKLLQNETLARKNAESKKQRILIFSFLAGFLIILVFSIFLYRLFIQKKIANIILSQQKEEISAQRDEIETQRDLVTEQKEHIEEIHKEVTDSINYAERIQRSFLATKELLDENLNLSLRGTASPDSSSGKQSLSTPPSLRGTKQSFEDETNYFVFFKPKDVVSGDFYWAGKLQNGNFALATADSTGHGVPGAIMSILNISSLEKAVEQGICEPSEILNHTRKTIIERLKKDGSPEGGKDGMDASLICFDFENLKLTYSAANNPIWIIRPVTQSSGLLDEPEVHVTGEDASANLKPQTLNLKLIELNPDKMPIGKHDKDQISFTQHEFQLQKGDVIYTLTDGFQDQFGGPKGKKFMTKNLKQLLITNCQLPMEEQKQVLEKTLVEWIGDGEQIDDITIMGIRI
ncbi:MAG: hypothetical protein A2046_15505 [Bacteroidetes bacterium GWA2_30_7]|nr:MAG: hypothetical protein A2046_15505 [Bacteroidetes bacterium GWA2_30_7]